MNAKASELSGPETFAECQKMGTVALFAATVAWRQSRQESQTKPPLRHSPGVVGGKRGRRGDLRGRLLLPPLVVLLLLLPPLVPLL
eukprot:COSAG04_NODE_15424_length_532_cov_0.849885_1_plen_85_part_10